MKTFQSLKRRAELALALALFAFCVAPAVHARSSTDAQWKTTAVYGQKIRYLEAGSGPTVILLHGLGGSASLWAPTIAPLAKTHRVIVPDQIGFGSSAKPLIDYRVATLVDFLDGFYKNLKIKRASLVGNSLGGFAAAAFALAHPEKVDRLVLVGSAGFALPKDFDPRTFDFLNPSTRAGMKQVLEAIFYDKRRFATDTAANDFFTKKLASGDGYTVQRFIASILKGEDVLDGKLDALKHPTLLVWGREDALTPLSAGERFKSEIPNSELLIIEKCGHVPQLEKPEEFNAAVLNFFKQPASH